MATGAQQKQELFKAIWAEDNRPQIDIKELNARIARIVENENRLRAEINAIIKELEEKII